MKLVFNLNHIPEYNKEKITALVNQQLKGFLEQMQNYNAVLVVTVDFLDKSKKQYKADLSVSSKYCSFAETSIQDNINDAIKTVCEKTKKQQKTIMWYIKK